MDNDPQKAAKAMGNRRTISIRHAFTLNNS
jgi:hypothetical protein